MSAFGQQRTSWILARDGSSARRDGIGLSVVGASFLEAAKLKQAEHGSGSMGYVASLMCILKAKRNNPRNNRPRSA